MRVTRRVVVGQLDERVDAPQDARLVDASGSAAMIRPQGSRLPIAEPDRGLIKPSADEVIMPTFLTIGYGDSAGYERTAPELRDAAHAHDARLRDDGAVIGIAGPPVHVRNHDAAGVTTTDGPFMSSSLAVAGFSLIEAPTLQDAIEMVSQTPCAVAHGVVEVWPLIQ
jgi:hypothetical protein